MSDLLFKCPECEGNLCVDEKAIGAKVNCTECGAKIKIPVSEFTFDCPKCKENLSISKSAKLSLFYCPKCNQRIGIPNEAPKIESPIKIAQIPTPKGLVRREMRTDGIIPMAKLANADEEQRKANERLVKSLAEMNAKQQKKALKPLFTGIKIILGLLVLWGVQVLFTKIFNNEWLGNGMFIVFICIFVPMYYRAKWLLGAEE